MLEGRIDKLQYTRTEEGKEYAAFWLEMQAFDKELRDVTERKDDTFIPIVVFDHHLLTYLRKVNAKNGNLVSVFGRLSSYRREFKDKIFRQVNVVVRDIHIIKTKNE